MPSYIDFNSITILGRVAATPKVSRTRNKRTAVSFSLAENFDWNGRHQVQYHSCAAYGQLAVICRNLTKKKLLKTGAMVLIQGRVFYSTWGGMERRKSTSVVISSIRILSGMDEEVVAAGEGVPDSEIPEEGVVGLLPGETPPSPPKKKTEKKAEKKEKKEAAPKEEAATKDAKPLSKHKRRKLARKKTGEV